MVSSIPCLKFQPQIAVNPLLLISASIPKNLRDLVCVFIYLFLVFHLVSKYLTLWWLSLILWPSYFLLVSRFCSKNCFFFFFFFWPWWIANIFEYFSSFTKSWVQASCIYIIVHFWSCLMFGLLALSRRMLFVFVIDVCFVSLVLLLMF